MANRIVRVNKIDNGYLTSVNYRTGMCQHYCKDFDELCLWLKDNLDSIEYAHDKKKRQKLKSKSKPKSKSKLKPKSKPKSKPSGDNSDIKTFENKISPVSCWITPEARGRYRQELINNSLKNRR